MKDVKSMKSQILGVSAPVQECKDRKCPFHGEINVKQELFRGRIIKKDVGHSATVEWHRPFYVPKFERHEVRRSRMRVHNPTCINGEMGEEVLVAKTRPLSKTKHHVILQVLHGATRSVLSLPNALSQPSQREDLLSSHSSRKKKTVTTKEKEKPSNNQK